MTNEEAALYMELYKMKLTGSVSDGLEEDIEAFNKSINALKQLDSIREIMDAVSYEENGVVYSYCYDPATRLSHIAQILHMEVNE